MAKNTKQISLMQQRHGKLNELPRQLSTSQFGFADDTNRLFIGNPDHPTLRNRYESDTFPYGNVEILTEFADNLDLIKYSPNMNGEKLFYPLIIDGTVENPSVSVNSSIIINDEEVIFTPESSYVGNCDYLVLDYEWEDGKDLDIKTEITNFTDEELNNKPIGWISSLYEFKDWDNTKIYHINDEVIYIDGNTYICIKDYDEESENWDNTKVYQIGDEVIYIDGNIYVCIKDYNEESVDVVTPLNIEYWKLKGDVVTPLNIEYWKPYQKKSFPYNTSITNSSMYWARDITSEATEEHHLFESVLISKKNLLENYRDKLPEILNIDLSATWFKRNGEEGKKGVKPIKLKVTVYRGGVMNLIGKKFVNDEKYIVKTFEYSVSDIPNDFNVYKKLASLKINKNNESVYFECNGDVVNEEQDTDQERVGLDNIVKQINDHFNETLVQAREFENRLQLFTLGSSITLDDGNNIDDVSTLEELGLVSDVYLSQPIYKRTLQEVIDDRYSIKSFEVIGDGITNDGPSINNALRIIYNTPKSDPKELYFPADVYNIVNTKLYIMTNTHFVGEGIDRTIIKGSQSSLPLMILADDELHFANEPDYCSSSEYPHNILFEDMTFDISSSNNSEIFFINHCYNIEFRNCKFIVKNKNFINSQSGSIIKNLKFNGCIFEGNNSSTYSQLIINGELDGLLITNCEFNNIKNTVIKFNGNENLIQNGIIGNNKFTNCSTPLIKCNENTRYISAVKTLVDNNVLLSNVDGKKILDSESDNNYCDTPVYNTDPNKYLRFNFYQSIYDYVQALYNKYGKNALEVISSDDNLDITNYLELTPGNNSMNLDDEINDNTISLNSTSQIGSVELGVGQFGDLHLGKKVEKIFPWKENTLYDKMEIIKYNDILYICIEKHKSSDVFDGNKWEQINSAEINEWNTNILYQVNDLVVYNDKLYRCIVEHTSSLFTTDIDKWDELGEYKSYIILHKDLDLNSNPIENKNGSDIILKLYEENNILIDESDESNKVPYYDRIGRYGNALTTVNYVTDIVNGGDKLIYNADKINKKVTEENSSEISIMNFDTDKYGNEVYLKDVSLNIRQLFIPIIEQIRKVDNCKYLDWNNRIYQNKLCTYNVGDKIKIQNPNNGLYEYYECITSHTASFDPEKDLYDNFMDDISYWASRSESGNEKEYVIYENVIYHYSDYEIICIFNPNSNLYEYYICIDSHDASYDPSKSDWENFNTDISKWIEITDYYNFNEYTLIPSPKHYNKNDKIKIFNENSQEFEYYISKADHNEEDYHTELYNNLLLNIENHDYWERVDLNNAFYYTIFDYSNIYWYKGDVVKTSFNNEYKFYACSEDHEASTLSNPEISFMNDFNLNRWKEVTDDSEDLRYIGLKIVDNKNNEIDKWIYDIKDVDLIARDTQGFNYPAWEPNKLYNYGNIANFNHTNYKCVAKNDLEQPTSHIYYGNDENAQIDLHNRNAWKALTEPGFDYIYHFERTLLIRDDDTSNGFHMNLINEDYQLDHNVSNHRIKLCLYDKNGELLDVLPYDISKYFTITPWEPNKTYYEAQYVSYNNEYYCCNITHTSKSNFEDDRIDSYNENINEGDYTSEQNRREFFVKVTDLYNSDTHQFNWDINKICAKGQHLSYDNVIYVSTKYHETGISFEDELKNGNLERAIEKYCQLGYSGDMIISIHFRKEKVNED